jgi:diguanylate cyclase
LTEWLVEDEAGRLTSRVARLTDGGVCGDQFVTEVRAGRLERLVARLGYAPWLVTAVGVSASRVIPSGGSGQVAESVVVGTLAVFFLVLLLRLLIATVAYPGRRVALISLSVGVALWAAGSAVLNSEGVPSSIVFPAPGEWLFLAAYAGFAAFLLLDGQGDEPASAGTWLDAAVACGGAGCLAGAVLVTPLADGFARQGVPLLVALTYPLLDLVLIAVVLGQVMLRQRAVNLRSASIVTGLVLFAVADTSLVRGLAGGRYDYGLVLDVCWLLGFLLLASAACRLRIERDVVSSPRGFTSSSVVLAEAVALTALIFQPSGGARLYVVIPATVTLLAAGARMVLALRAARGAAEALRLSYTDDLTGLPNRRALTAKVDGGLSSGEPLGLLLLDLDGFKEINDSIGHAAGDMMLRILATRLRKAFQTRVLVTRLGGDEFALVAPHADPVQLLELAREVLDVVRKPARVDGLELEITGSIGLTVRETGDTECGDLLRRADVAMYQAKTDRSGALLYDAGRDEFTRQRLAMAEELRRAIGAGELEVWYQPQVEAVSGKVCAVEALIRWRHPVDGLISPGAFLPVARRSGLMGAISELVIDTVIADLSRWREAGLGFSAALNLAPPELLGGTVLHRMFERLHMAQLPAGSLTVEVTEDSFLAEPERARELLVQIRDQGVQVSIDDYGTGFSSLSYLRDLPVQELKIDRSFVAAVLSDPRSRMIVASTNQLAHGLGLRTVAEGVEDTATLAELVALGLDVVQGYHVAKPMPADQIAVWVADWSRQNALFSG